MGAKRRMVIADERIKKLIENNLDYAELLLVPEPTDLVLIDKDAGLGNIDKKQQARLTSCFNSLHSIQRFTIPTKIYVYNFKDDNDKIQQIPINETLYSEEYLAAKLKEGTLSIVIKDLPRYPAAYQDLKSRISSLLVTSGSLDGFRATLQHSSIIKQKQDSTLEEINPLKKNKRGKNKQ